MDRIYLLRCNAILKALEREESKLKDMIHTFERAKKEGSVTISALSNVKFKVPFDVAEPSLLIFIDHQRNCVKEADLAFKGA